MISFQEYGRVITRAFDEAINNRSRRRSSVDVIAKKNFDGLMDRIRHKMRIYARKHLIEKVNLTVNISNRINASSNRNFADSCSGLTGRTVHLVTKFDPMTIANKKLFAAKIAHRLMMNMRKLLICMDSKV